MGVGRELVLAQRSGTGGEEREAMGVGAVQPPVAPGWKRHRERCGFAPSFWGST